MYDNLTYVDDSDVCYMHLLTENNKITKQRIYDYCGNIFKGIFGKLKDYSDHVLYDDVFMGFEL